MSLLVSSCLSVWSGCTPALLYEVIDSKFQVPSVAVLGFELHVPTWLDVSVEWRGALPRPPSVIGFVLGLYKHIPEPKLTQTLNRFPSDHRAVGKRAQTIRSVMITTTYNVS